MSLFTGAKFALLRQGTYGTIRLGESCCSGNHTPHSSRVLLGISYKRGGGAKRYFSKNRNIYNDRFLVSVGNMFLFPSGIYYSIKDRWERNNRGLKMPLPHLVLLGGTAGVIGSYVSFTLPRFIIQPLSEC